MTYNLKYLSTYVYWAISVYLFIYLSIYLSIYLYIFLSFYLSIYLSIYLFIYLSIFLSVYLSIYLSIYISIYISIYLYIYLYIYLSIYLSLYVYRFYGLRSADAYLLVFDITSQDSFRFIASIRNTNQINYFYKKRFYNKETIAALNYEIHQMSIIPPVPFYETKMINPFHN